MANVLNNEDMQALRNYVQGPSSQMTIEQLKVKLSFHVGTNASAQVLQLKDDSGRVIAPFMEDHHKLGYYSPHDGSADPWTTHFSSGGHALHAHSCKVHCISLHACVVLVWSQDKRAKALSSVYPWICNHCLFSGSPGNV
eukprot:1157613-Pelagomonas_calceolata.AAC.6